ncbi:MAG: hypothetical protein KF696_15685 [Planctomycetes bacterium]|nr:hypothetical protein [Planctomycetota bacterium]MCW8136251.1 hypothetical protein [Planctomycetota bacterium]
MSNPPLRISRPLRYTILCEGCKGEISICPDELNERLAVCPRCRMPNRTPVFGLLSGRRKAADQL